MSFSPWPWLKRLSSCQPLVGVISLSFASSSPRDFITVKFVDLMHFGDIIYISSKSQDCVKFKVCLLKSVERFVDFLSSMLWTADWRCCGLPEIDIWKYNWWVVDWAASHVCSKYQHNQHTSRPFHSANTEYIVLSLRTLTNCNSPVIVTSMLKLIGVDERSTNFKTS